MVTFSGLLPNTVHMLICTTDIQVCKRKDVGSKLSGNSWPVSAISGAECDEAGIAGPGSSMCVSADLPERPAGTKVYTLISLRIPHIFSIYKKYRTWPLQYLRLQELS